jgi:hypothetical protein
MKQILFKNSFDCYWLLFSEREIERRAIESTRLRYFLKTEVKLLQYNNKKNI